MCSLSTIVAMCEPHGDNEFSLKSAGIMDWLLFGNRRQLKYYLRLLVYLDHNNGGHKIKNTEPKTRNS